MLHAFTTRRPELASVSDTPWCGWLDVMTTRRPSGGRPSKGDRDLLVTRPAHALGDIVRARAAEQELTISEYIATVLAEVHKRPDLAPSSARRDQEELPLKSA